MTMPLPEPQSLGPYAAAAQAYWAAGWRGVLPLPTRKKTPPPDGWTGAKGGWPSFADVFAWCDGHEGNGNVALRLPHHILGLDVDNYDGKHGGSTLQTGEEKWGVLPATWKTTSRDDGISGIRLYRVPEGMSWPGELGPATEIIQYRHRYAVVWPSVHPEGRIYRWVRPDGAYSLEPPNVDELPDLPEAWVAGLSAGRAEATIERADLNDGQTIEWLSDRHGLEEPCPGVARALGRYLEDLKAGQRARHDTALAGTARLARMAGEGHLGVFTALAKLRLAFLEATTAGGRHGQRDERTAQREWASMLAGAVRIAAHGAAPAETVEDPCTNPYAGLIRRFPDPDVGRAPQGPPRAVGTSAEQSTRQPAEHVLRGVFESREQAEACWEVPEPLGSVEPERAEFPVDALPVRLRLFVTAVASHTQTPVEMAAMAALAALSTVAANRVWIHGGRGWIEPTILWTLTVMPPASRKSAVMSKVARPLNLIETELRDLHAAEHEGKAERGEIAKKRLAKTIEKAAGAKTSHERVAFDAELDEARTEVEDTTVPPAPQLLVDDITPEALGFVMQQNDGHVGCLNAEGGLFGMLAGRYTNGVSNLDLFLKSHDGEPYRVNRIGREPFMVASPALALGLAVQPNVLAETTKKPELQERGLMGRFLYAVPVSTVGTRTVTSPTIPVEVETGWHHILQGIVRNPVGDWENHATLEPDPAALQKIDDFRDYLEARMHERDGDLAFMSDWVGKLAGKTLRIAALLHLADGRPVDRMVDAQVMASAITLAQWALTHAHRVYGGWRSGGSESKAAESILDYCRRKGLLEFTVRDMWQALRGQTWCTDAEAVKDAVLELSEKGWVASVARTYADGRRRSPAGVFLVNPALFEEDESA